MIQTLLNDDGDKWKTKHIKLIPTVVDISFRPVDRASVP